MNYNSMKVGRRQYRGLVPVAAAVLSLILGLGLTACASRLPDPLVSLAGELANHQEYSVVLVDMEQRGNFVKSYFHRYDLIEGDQAADGDEITFVTKQSDWFEVDKQFYERYQPSLGMVVLSKSGDQPAAQEQYPPGYQYVGNERYGRWNNDSNGGSFWEFYGKYALFSNLLGMGNRRLYRSDYDAYRTNRSQRRPYYGPSGNYGTRGSVTRRTNPSFFARQQQRQATRSRDFSSRVRNRTGRSTSRSRGGSFRGK